MNTLVVNLFAGPGTGKSTTAALVFGKLKTLGVNCEIVHEFAKDLTWEQRDGALSFQPYVLGSQAYHVQRLIGQVDVIVTDSPILLCGHIYGDNPIVGELAHDIFDTWNTYNIFLERNPVAHPYNPAGRNQSEKEAGEIDQQILNMLESYYVDYKTYKILGGEQTATKIAYDVYIRLPRIKA